MRTVRASYTRKLYSLSTSSVCRPYPGVPALAEIVVDCGERDPASLSHPTAYDHDLEGRAVTNIRRIRYSRTGAGGVAGGLVRGPLVAWPAATYNPL